jgi:c-di-GMP-binding flagellar brake protein YcgR
MVTSAERRRHPRYEIPVRLRIELPDGRDLRTRALNVSEGGAYFLTEEGFEVGREVSLRLAIPRDTANTFFLEQFAAKARVVRRESLVEGQPGAGIALRFEKQLPLDLP